MKLDCESFFAHIPASNCRLSSIELVAFRASVTFEAGVK